MVVRRKRKKLTKDESEAEARRNKQGPKEEDKGMEAEDKNREGGRQREREACAGWDE